ncbi:hypothetical protein PMALA_078790, partial [Plasmodium malariae]
CIYGKSFYGNCMYDRKIDIKPYRLLEKYKYGKDSNNVRLKERLQNTEIDKQKDIPHNEKVTKRKNKQSNKSLLNKSQNNFFNSKRNGIFKYCKREAYRTYKINCNVGRCIHNATLYWYNGLWDTYHCDSYPIFDKNLEDLLQ